MTDEENKAIKDCDSIFICLDDAMSEDSANDYRKSYKILKNLIEKQSKEIEELKEKNRQGKMRIVQLENEITARIEDVNKYFTPNDKIKAKIEYNKVFNDDIHKYAVLTLEELLEKG